MYFSMDYIADSYIGENLTGKVAGFLKELVFHPLIEDGGFSAAYVESEKVNLKNSIQGLINDKKEYADVKCREAMFGKDGYGMFEAGYVEDLDSITPQSLYAFYQTILTQAKADIFVGGTVKEENLACISQVLAPEFVPRDAGFISTSLAVPERKEVQMVTESMQTAQSKLAIGLKLGIDPTGEDYYALMLGGCIFGGSPFSKLFLNVREKLSLAYYAGCRTDRLKSVMTISSGIETRNFQKAYDEILVQLAKMQAGEITQEELAAAQKYLGSGLIAMYDNMRVLEDYYLSQAILGQNQSPEELIEKLSQVTVENIQKVMQGLAVDTVYFLKGEA